LLDDYSSSSRERTLLIEIRVSPRPSWQYAVPQEPQGGAMTRRTLDLIFAIGGLILAGLVLVLGLVLQSQANFAHDEVHKQLSAQQIFFTPASALKPNENDPCLKKYAGQQLVTGKQAQCYADHYIAVHLGEVNNGKTYAQTSNELRALPDQTSGEAKDLMTKVQTLFQGETLRGLLLTSYGFSIFGDRAQTVAYLCYALAGVLFLASIAGFIHAATRSAEREILPHPEPSNT
jgi:hypothetical protein